MNPIHHGLDVSIQRGIATPLALAAAHEVKPSQMSPSSETRGMKAGRSLAEATSRELMFDEVSNES